MCERGGKLDGSTEPARDGAVLPECFEAAFLGLPGAGVDLLDLGTKAGMASGAYWRRRSASDPSDLSPRRSPRPSVPVSTLDWRSSSSAYVPATIWANAAGSLVVDLGERPFDVETGVVRPLGPSEPSSACGS